MRPPLGSAPRSHLLASHLDAIAAEAGETPQLVEDWPGKSAWVMVTSTRAYYVASPEVAARRFPLEAARIRWAASLGVPVPEVLEVSVDRLVLSRVRRDRVGGDPRFLRSLLAAADVLAGAPVPDPALLHGGRSRRASRRTLAQRLARISASPLGVREVAATRRAAAALPAPFVAHGDFHPENLPFDAAAGTVHVVDWEMLCLAPAGYDALSTWPFLDDAEDRAAVLDVARRATGADDQVATLLHWIAVRRVADLVAGVPRASRDLAAIDVAMARLVEARRIARLLAG